MKLRLVAALGLSAALALTACGDQNDTASETPAASDAAETPAEGTEETAGEETAGEESAAEDSEAAAAPAEVSGELRGMGASSMKNSQDAWTSKFAEDQGGRVTATYDAQGSGNGRGALESGGIEFAGTDRAFKIDENQAGKFKSCADDSIVLDIPVYISPIAVVFNLDGVDSLNLTPETVAKIFAGQITKWDDEAIKETNPDANLPSDDITVIYRADKSGTTQNFTEYLKANAGDVWTNDPAEEWPLTDSGQSAEKTDGVKNTVSQGKGSIGYIDASAAQDMTTAKIGKDGNFFDPMDNEAAAQIVENSPLEEGREEHDLALELDRTGDGYPIVLVSYVAACQHYQKPETAELVKAYLTFITSEEGQTMSEQQSGAAPLPEGMREKINAAIESIS